jgi:hypothetical protein
MERRCHDCGGPATREHAGYPLCEQCAAASEEYDRNHAAAAAGLIEWNTSLHDPWWRNWLTSRELYAAFRNSAPLAGRRIHTVAGGEVFECCVHDRRLQVWLTDSEVLVAYAPVAEQYGWPDHPDGPHQFEEWAAHLRGSPPLQLGRVRGRCSYGAAGATTGVPPSVKWAQAGDWAAAARAWQSGAERPTKRRRPA